MTKIRREIGEITHAFYWMNDYEQEPALHFLQYWFYREGKQTSPLLEREISSPKHQYSVKMNIKRNSGMTCSFPEPCAVFMYDLQDIKETEVKGTFLLSTWKPFSGDITWSPVVT